MKQIRFVAVAIAALAAAPFQTSTHDSAVRNVVRCAIDAHGGHKNLKRSAIFYWRADVQEGVGAKRDTIKTEVWVHLPGRMKIRREQEHATGGQQTTIATQRNDQVWHSVNGKTEEVSRKRFGWADLLYYTWLVPLLDDSKLKLSRLPDKRMNNRTLEGVRITGPSRLPASLYFDKETHLLVLLCTSVYPTDQEEVESQVSFSEYKTIHGVKWPMKRIQVVGPWRAECTIKELTVLKTIPADTFAKP